MTDTVLTNGVADRRDGNVAEQVSGVGDFFQLLKPRVMSLVVFTGFVGLVIAPGTLHPVLAVIAILCIAVGSGAAGAINMWYDRDIDAVMERTAKRPIPAGRVAPDDALVFGGLLSLFSVGLLGLTTNWVAAGLLGSAILFYVFVYTIWLKRRTPQNIVIGGAAGAFPPMIGWAAVTGEISMLSVVLFAIIFLWTPPHFWALSLVKAGDYKKAGIPMLPCVAGEPATRRHIAAYTLPLLVVAPLPWLMGSATLFYGVVSTILGVGFAGLVLDVLRTGGSSNANRSAMRLFLFSIFYLFALFAVLMLERIVGMVLHG